MSETLRDLVVALSLDASQFDKNIRLVNRQLKEAESEFLLAGAGAEHFEDTLAGMRQKAAYLEKQLVGQNRIMEQYSGKLRQANEDLNAATARHESLRGRLQGEIRARDELSEQLTVQRQALKEIRQAHGAESDEMREALEALADLSMEYRTAQDAVKKTTGQITAAERAVRKQAEVIEDTNTKLNLTKVRVKELRQELALASDGWYMHGAAMSAWAQRAKSASQTWAQAGGTLTMGVTTPLIAAGTAAVKASIDYESAFAGVRKTVNASEEDFKRLSDSAVEMSTRLATSAVDIAGVMAIAGQLGIANEELSSFTETVVRMGMSTNLSGEEGASSMARFANITGMAQSKFRNLGSTLVYLGNNFATTEAEIMAMAMRIAAAGTQVGLTQPQILGFAAALSSLGMEAEAGGSAFSKALKLMETSVATGDEALKDFADVAGLTRREFAALWERDPAAAFEAFIVGLSRMDEEGIGAIATLSEIGITEIRLSDTLLRSANATQILADAQQGANRAWADGTALLTESETRLATTESRLVNVKNSLVEVGMQFGDAMDDTLEWLIEGLREGVQRLDALDEGTKRNIVQWGLFAAAAGPVIGGIGKVGSAITGTIDTIGKFSQAIGKANAAFKTTGSVANWIGTLLGPGGMVVAGVAASAAAIAGLIALFNRLERTRPDFAMTEDEIRELAYKPVDIEVNTQTTITGDVLSLKDEFVRILNDGVPETQTIQDGMKSKVDAAVEAAYGLIETAYNEKKVNLDAMFAAGLVDETTYNSALTTMETQASVMQSSLAARSGAVTAYVTTLCTQNRAMTDEEIATLNELLNALGATVEQAEAAAEAHGALKELSKQQTRLGLADEETQMEALEAREEEAEKKIADIEIRREKLKRVYADSINGKPDEEVRSELERLEQSEALLDQEEKLIRREQAREDPVYVQGILKAAGIGMEELRAYAQWTEEFDKKFGSRSGIGWLDKFTVMMQAPSEMDKYWELIDRMTAFEAKLSESGVLADGSPLQMLLATRTEQGMIPEGTLDSWQGMADALIAVSGAAQEVPAALKTLDEMMAEQGVDTIGGLASGIEGSGQDATDALQAVADEMAEIFPTTFDSHSPSRRMYRQGRDMMSGLVNGIHAGRGAVVSAMRSAARDAAEAAQNELKVRSMTSASYTVPAAASGSIFNSSTKQEFSSSVNVSGNTFVVRDQQDVRSLASEIAVLAQAQMRGRGAK